MKITAMIAAAAIMLASPALAQNASASLSGSQSSVTVEGSKSYKQAPAVGTTTLTTSNDTCQGSIALPGFSGGGFGISLGGKTYTVHSCDARADATLLGQLGYREAAYYRLAQNPKIARALRDAAQAKARQVKTRSASRGITPMSQIPCGAAFINKRTGKRGVKGC